MSLMEQSGFLLLTEGMEAYARRIQLIEQAQQSVDIQSYIFEDGHSTRRFILSLLAAAERGVRVRLLFDDLSIGHQQSQLEKLNSHPNIEIKLFNPLCRGRHWSLTRLIMLAIHWSRLHRRMHNKLWLADDKAAIWGGRNLGDDYFFPTAHPLFIDLDILAINGRTPQQLAQSFAAYWQHPLAVPLIKLMRRKQQPTKWQILKKQLQYKVANQTAIGMEYQRAEQLIRVEQPEGLIRRLINAPARVYWDHPDKAAATDRPDIRLTISGQLSRELASLHHNIQIVSGYLVPIDIDGLDIFALLARQIEVTCLTNALEATDVPLVHGGYASWRIPLLKAGAKLYEFRHRPWPRARLKGRLHGRTRLKLSLHRYNALHAKTFVFDDDRILVGSLNVDPRSVWWNCELAVVIDSKLLNQELRRVNSSIMQLQHSYELHLINQHLQWLADNGTGQQIVFMREPGNLWRKLQACAAKWLNLQKLL